LRAALFIHGRREIRYLSGTFINVLRSDSGKNYLLERVILEKAEELKEALHVDGVLIRRRLRSLSLVDVHQLGVQHFNL